MAAFVHEIPEGLNTNNILNSDIKHSKTTYLSIWNCVVYFLQYLGSRNHE